jgi:alpha-N-acetylglucosamine transferase
MTTQEMYIRALMQTFYVLEEQSHSYTAANIAVDALRTDIIDADYTAEDADEEVILCDTPIIFHNISLKRCCAVKLNCLHCTSLKCRYTYCNN